jgi:hypothetical protein
MILFFKLIIDPELYKWKGEAMKIRTVMRMSVMAVCAIYFMMGCATPYPMGSAYTNVKLPVIATAATDAPKVGTSECKSYFGLVAVGDASIDAAMKNGGIRKVHHVDWEASNILGIIGTYKTVVYGE